MGLISVLLAWYYGTRNIRLKKKLVEHENKLFKIETYVSQTGYKNMLHDCFHTFSYVGGVVLITLGIKSFAMFFLLTQACLKFFDLFIAGVYIGSGLVLIELFILLSKANKPKDSMQTMKAKIEKIKCEIE
ncbi:hypothetical protein CW745_05135 [Psychromonas sp. psych-6C06]|nr:hypothetical protein CW745_05135 [Psychromonas sp. psych-6C06]